MDSSGLQSSQFADTCNIPRPTLSQLLNGRNKKVSDEIIAKVHNGFPELNVLWLLFGEGNMYMNGNNQVSQPKTGTPPYSIPKQKPTDQDITEYQEPNIFAGYFNQPENIPITTSGETSGNDLMHTKTNHNSGKPEEHNNAESSSRKITSILVFYDDNSFESFVPSSEIK